MNRPCSRATSCQVGTASDVTKTSGTAEPVPASPPWSWSRAPRAARLLLSFGPVGVVAVALLEALLELLGRLAHGPGELREARAAEHEEHHCEDDQELGHAEVHLSPFGEDATKRYRRDASAGSPTGWRPRDAAAASGSRAASDAPRNGTAPGPCPRAAPPATAPASRGRGRRPGWMPRAVRSVARGHVRPHRTGRRGRGTATRLRDRGPPRRTPARAHGVARSTARGSTPSMCSSRRRAAPRGAAAGRPCPRRTRAAAAPAAAAGR